MTRSAEARGLAGSLLRYHNERLLAELEEAKEETRAAARLATRSRAEDGGRRGGRRRLGRGGRAGPGREGGSPAARGLPGAGRWRHNPAGRPAPAERDADEGLGP